MCLSVDIQKMLFNQVPNLLLKVFLLVVLKNGAIFPRSGISSNFDLTGIVISRVMGPVNRAELYPRRQSSSWIDNFKIVQPFTILLCNRSF